MYTDELASTYAPRLLAMVQTPGWIDYVDVLTTKILVEQEIALADDPGALLEHRGYIRGVRSALSTADEVLSFVRQESGEKKEVSERARAARGKF